MPSGSSPLAALCTAALVEVARGTLPPDEPEVLRLVAALLWRIEAKGHGARRAAFMSAARDLGVSAGAAEGLVRECLDVDLQRRLEELILPRVEPAWIPRYVRLEGEVEAGLLLGLDRPHPLVAISALAARVPGLAVVAPEGEAGSRAERWLQQRFARERRAMRVRWLVRSQDGPLADGSSGPCFVAVQAGRSLDFSLPERARVQPVFVHRERDKRWRVQIGEVGTSRDAEAALVEHARRWAGQHLAPG